MEIGEYIKALRLAKGMTLEQVGDAVGVGKSTVRKWETGNIKNMGRDKIAALARALGTSPDAIINCGETDADPEPPVSTEESALLERFRSLPPEKQRLLLSLAQELQ